MKIKRSAMSSAKITVKGSEIPEAWAKQAGVGGDELVEVVIRPDRRTAAKRLFESTARMRKQAKERGLTPEKLASLLNDA